MNHCRHQVTGQAEWTLACPDCEIERLRDERDIFKRTLDKRDAERDALRAALESTTVFLNHCWTDVQLNEYSFERLERLMGIVDAALRGEGE